MAWSSGPPTNAATFPSHQPALNYYTGATTEGVATIRPAPLTFRKDTAAGIVYVTGYWDLVGAPNGITSLYSAPVPAIFRPATDQYVTGRTHLIGGATDPMRPFTIATTGLMTQISTSGGTTNVYLSGFYFTDV